MKAISVIPKLLKQNLHRIDFSLIQVMNDLESDGWEFYATSNDRGYCDFRYKFITLPQHAFLKDDSYLNWYLAHEMAHAYAGYEAKHGPLFMKKLQSICPTSCIHHELNYNPKNAMLAGILAEDF